MNIFLSWSGEQSRLAAEAVQDWLPLVINAVKPWHSREDIGAGKRWSHEIQLKLEQTKFGILFITPSNLSKPWIMFEAGALAKSLEDTYVCPYLLNLKTTDIPGGPLAQFQAKVADREGTWQLVQTINSAIKDDPIPEKQLEKAFEKWWPELQEKLENLPDDPASLPVERNPNEMTEEILTIVRRLDRNDPDSSSVVRVVRTPSNSPYTTEEIHAALESVRFNNLQKSIDWDQFSKMLDKRVIINKNLHEEKYGSDSTESSKDDKDDDEPQFKE